MCIIESQVLWEDNSYPHQSEGKTFDSCEILHQDWQPYMVRFILQTV